MRGTDPETGEFLGPSRSEQRREALDIRSLGEKLVALAPAHLAKLPIPEDLLEHIHETQRITSHGARKRQQAFLAKQMRKLDDEVLDAIRDAMSKDGEAARRETAALHRAEALRDALLGDDGDAALTDLLAAHPQADRQKLRQLVRNAREERAKNKPPRAFREIYQVLRELMLPAQAAASDDDADDEDVEHDFDDEADEA